MRNLIIATILSTAFLSCNSSTEKEKPATPDYTTDQINSDFEDYISSLDKIPLPLKTNIHGQLPEISQNYDKTSFRKYKHTWTSHPLGIYYQDGETVGIIDLSVGDWGLVPFLTTYDVKGNKIDSTGFYHKTGGDMGYDAIEYVTFNADRTIIAIDTVKSWDLNEDETDIIEGSMKMTTGKVEYRILENGQIKKK